MEWARCASRREGALRFRGASQTNGRPHSESLTIHREIPRRDRPTGGRVLPAPLQAVRERTHSLPELLRSPLGAQADAIRAAALSLRNSRGTTVVGEMGTGKSFIATAAAHMAGFRRTVVLCPPHLVRKWKREIEETVPGAHAAIVTSITDLERLRTIGGDKPLFAVMSRERAKLSFRWQPAVVERWAAASGRLFRDDATGEPFRVPCCPDCYAMVLDTDGVPLTDRDLSRRRRTCNACGSALWQADNSGPRRYPLADYIKHRMAGFFDLLIGDEMHEFKSRGSAQGIAAGILADVCGRTLSLTGTLMGGYASTLFHLLYRFSPQIRSEFARSDEHRWVERYGFVEHTVGKPSDRHDEDGRASRRRRYRKVVRERPGLAPAALFHLIGNSIFLRLSDVASGLPSVHRGGAGLGHGHGTRLHRVLPAVGLRGAVRDPQGRTRRRPRKGIEAPARRVPSDPARLPGRVHKGRDGVRSRDRRGARAGAASI